MGVSQQGAAALPLSSLPLLLVPEYAARVLQRFVTVTVPSKSPSTRLSVSTGSSL